MSPKCFLIPLLACALVPQQVMEEQVGVMEEQVGMDGHCPILAAKGDWRKGKPEYSVQYDGITYYFSSKTAIAQFQKFPMRYVPALGGDCVVCLKLEKKRIKGNTNFIIRHKSPDLGFERIFLFPNFNSAYREFLANASNYATIDIANRGRCPITGKPGRADFAVMIGGFWYLCDSNESMEKFENERNAKLR